MGRFVGLLTALAGLASIVAAQDVSGQKIAQLQAAMQDTNGQIDTTDNGVQANTSNSLRAGPRGYNLLEDTSVRKKMLHFDRERAPERVRQPPVTYLSSPDLTIYSRSSTPSATAPTAPSNPTATSPI
jgi:hypothetical protein